MSSDVSPLREQKRKCRNAQFSSEFDPMRSFGHEQNSRMQFSSPCVPEVHLIRNRLRKARPSRNSNGSPNTA